MKIDVTSATCESLLRKKIEKSKIRCAGCNVYDIVAEENLLYGLRLLDFPVLLNFDFCSAMFCVVRRRNSGRRAVCLLRFYAAYICSAPVIISILTFCSTNHVRTWFIFSLFACVLDILVLL